MDHRDIISNIAALMPPRAAIRSRRVSQTWLTVVDKIWPRGLVAYPRAIRLARGELRREVRDIQTETHERYGKIVYLFRGRLLRYYFEGSHLFATRAPAWWYYINYNGGSLRRDGRAEEDAIWDDFAGRNEDLSRCVGYPPMKYEYG